MDQTLSARCQTTRQPVGLSDPVHTEMRAPRGAARCTGMMYKHIGGVPEFSRQRWRRPGKSAKAAVNSSPFAGDGNIVTTDFMGPYVE